MCSISYDTNVINTDIKGIYRYSGVNKMIIFNISAKEFRNLVLCRLRPLAKDSSRLVQWSQRLEFQWAPSLGTALDGHGVTTHSLLSNACLSSTQTSSSYGYYYGCVTLALFLSFEPDPEYSSALYASNCSQSIRGFSKCWDVDVTMLVLWWSQCAGGKKLRNDNSTWWFHCNWNGKSGRKTCF
jgi:hypothetical protein